MSYTTEKIEELRRKAEEYDLEGRQILDLLDNTALTATANGIGADWMPDWSRALINGLHPSLEAAALIHDVEYHAGGSAEDRAAADSRFRTNCLKSAEAAYPWWDIRRYFARESGRRFYRLLRTFGSWAWPEKAGDEI